MKWLRKMRIRKQLKGRGAFAWSCPNCNVVYINIDPLEPPPLCAGCKRQFDLIEVDEYAR